MFFFSREKKLQSSPFVKSFFEELLSTLHNVEKREIFSHRKKFRQINSLVTYFVKPLLSRNFCQKCVRENSRNFHTVHFKYSTRSVKNSELYSRTF